MDKELAKKEWNEQDQFYEYRLETDTHVVYIRDIEWEDAEVRLERKGMSKANIEKELKDAEGWMEAAAEGMMLVRIVAKVRQSDEGLPLETTDRPWLYAYRAMPGYPDHTQRGGKWLLFISPDHLHEVWQQIRQAVEKGHLGGIAKVATKINSTGGGRVYVICVYTYDAEDVEDVRRVRLVLREMGFLQKLSYKADEDTREGRYSGHKNGQRVSRYYE